MRFVDGTRGVVCGRGTYTCFPVAAMRGAAFDPALEEAVGHAIAEEVLDAGGNLFGGVCVNLPVHPGWGRAQESYGEDPCLLGKMGAALVRGVQDRGVIACVKHFAFNSMENARFKVSVSCSKRAEREVFLPHFQKCIEAGAGALMCAYNSYQGVLCGHHDYLLNRVLKGEWGFDGFVMNDFLWGIRDTVEAVNGGLDLEMPATQFFGEKLVRAVREGKVPESRIDEAALRILRTLLAHRERCAGALPGGKLTPEQFRQHADLALQCAREGITLLKNEGGNKTCPPPTGTPSRWSTPTCTATPCWRKRGPRPFTPSVSDCPTPGSVWRCSVSGGRTGRSPRRCRWKTPAAGRGPRWCSCISGLRIRRCPGLPAC